MKKYSVLITFLLTLFTAYAGNDPKNVTPEIKEATVFLSRAQLISTVSSWIEAGTTDVVLEGLSPFIEGQSIQISGKGDFTIMSVKHQLNYIEVNTNSAEINKLTDSIEAINLRIQLLESMREVYQKEEQMILANQSIKGNEKGITATELEDMADFYRDRLTEINEEQIYTEIKIKKLRLELNKYQYQLTELNKARNQPTSKIIVTLSAKARVNAALEVSYIVNNAGWYPIYDVRALDTKNPIQLNYKAQVFQNTGVDWKNVKLSLSTANPSLGGTKPELSAWYLNIYAPVALKKYKSADRSINYSSGSYAPSAAPMDKISEQEEIYYGADATTVADYTQAIETSISAEFRIAVPYSIETGGSGQLVDIQTHSLPASFRYYAVPKMDKDAFLTAMVTGWENLNMISGKANIYFEGTYVGEAFFDMQNTKDTLFLSMGRDPKIVVKRESITDYTTKKVIGTNRTEEYAYKISVRNTKRDPIEIVIQDQYPVSQTNEVEVELLESNGAEINKDYGYLEWKIKVNAAEEKSVQFRYSVKYPKNKRVAGL